MTPAPQSAVLDRGSGPAGRRSARVDVPPAVAQQRHARRVAGQHLHHLEQGEHVVALFDQALQPAVQGREPAAEHDRVAGRGAGPRHRLQQVPRAGPPGRGETGGDDRVRLGEDRQRAAADLLEHLRRVARGGQADRDQRRRGRHAHHRGDRRPDVVDAVLHGQQAHPGGVLAEGGGELPGVDRHGRQSSTRVRMGTSSAQEQTYDVVVLGAGPVGENVADYAHRGGLSVAVVERELVGGECSYWACIPSKALLRPAHALAAARRLPGITADGLDAAAVLARRDAFVHDYDDASQVGWLEGAGIALVRGTGRLAGERRVDVTGPDGVEVLEAPHAVVVCTGSDAVVPPVPGLAETRPWGQPRRHRDARGAAAARGARRRRRGRGDVAGRGGARRRAGDRPRARRPAAAARLEPFAGELLLEGLQASGVDVRFGVEARRVDRAHGVVRVELADGGVVEADEVLVATGRRPRTGDLGVETVGLEPGRPLTTDDGLAVQGVDGGWLFAAGDVNGRVLLTHQGKYQARLLGDRLAAAARGEPLDLAPWGAHTPTADDAAVPQVVFTDPEVAAVGLTSAQAEQRGLRTRLVTHDLGAVAGASLLADGYRGRAGLLVDLDRSVVVGATFVGPDVAELLHAATVAVVGEVPLDRLWHAVPSFPTVSEVWLRLLEGCRDGD